MSLGGRTAYSVRLPLSHATGTPHAPPAYNVTEWFAGGETVFLLVVLARILGLVASLRLMVSFVATNSFPQPLPRLMSKGICVNGKRAIGRRGAC